MGHLVAGASFQDRVWLQQVVLDAFHDAHAGLRLVVERADRERQRGELGIDLLEHIARGLHLEAVGLVDLALEDRGAAFAGQRLLGASRVAHIDRVHLIGLERDLGRAVLSIELLGDDLVAVDHEALHLVHERALERLDAVGLLKLGQCLGHLQVRVARLDQTRTDLHGVVGALQHISVSALKLREGSLSGRAFLRHDGRVGDNSDEAVNVAAQVDLDPVAGLDLERLVRERREVAQHLVD